MPCGGKFSKLDGECSKAAGLTPEGLRHLSDPVAPYGTDAMWASGHVSSDLAPEAFWNTSNTSDEVRCRGARASCRCCSAVA